jgi:[ribosomal protein S18]-alanine N-acetyltransferase
MVETVLIRPLVVEDLPSILRIEEATYPTPWTEGIFRDELAAAGRVYLVAEENDQVVGYSGLMVVLPEAHVTSVTVDPRKRGSRIGTRLMLRVCHEALAAGANSLTLEVRVSNRNAQALYQRFGMAPVGVRKRYYKDEDALVMWVHDIDSEAYRERLDEIGRSL